MGEFTAMARQLIELAVEGEGPIRHKGAIGKATSVECAAGSTPHMVLSMSEDKKAADFAFEDVVGYVRLIRRLALDETPGPAQSLLCEFDVSATDIDSVSVFLSRLVTGKGWVHLGRQRVNLNVRPSSSRFTVLFEAPPEVVPQVVIIELRKSGKLRINASRLRLVPMSGIADRLPAVVQQKDYS